MKPTHITALIATLLGSAIHVALAAGPAPAHWPQFRGPNGSGLAPDDQPAPVTFGPDKNCLWQTGLPPGHSSPCIWDNRIFLTAFDQDSKRLETLCLDRASGKILWRTPAPKMETEKQLHQFSSPAASTPATDGERVYLYFGAYGAVAYDFTGKEVWARPLPAPPTKYGTASSPIVSGNLVVLQRDGNSTNSQLLALEAKTGRTTWTANRPLNGESFSTPMLWKHDGAEEIITVGNGRLDAYDAHDGHERWWTPGLTMQPITVAVAGDGLLFASSSLTGSPSEPIDFPTWEGLLKRFDRNGDGQLTRDEVPEDAAIQLRKEVPRETPGNMLNYQFLLFGFFDANKDGIFTKDEWQAMEQFTVKNQNNVLAIRPGGNGNISTTHVQWKGSRGISEMPSPLFYRERLYFVKDGGMLTSYDPKSGKVVLDRGRLGVASQFVASPVASGGNIYAASVPGRVVVIKAADTLEVLAINDLKEAITATPAVLDGKIYVRTARHLYAFGE
ncbi:MAG: outer membrane protein assembly factor BamB family protein [Limisphaerales bacterium]